MPVLRGGGGILGLAEIVRQRLGIAEEDPVEVAAASLAAGLNRIVADPEERAHIGVRLGRLLGVTAAADSGGSLSQKELFAGWRLFFERLAGTGPVTLLVEGTVSTVEAFTAAAAPARNRAPPRQGRTGLRRDSGDQP